MKIKIKKAFVFFFIVKDVLKLFEKLNARNIHHLVAIF